MQLPNVGDIFAEHYRLDANIGEGGFATVFRAVDTRVGRSVAVKVLKPNNGAYNTSRAARFLREARIVGDLQDANTVRLFDFGQTSTSLLFMVFELLEGEDLRSVIDRRGRLREHEVEHIFRQILSSLAEAHHRGLVHRDVKPQNIRVFAAPGDDMRAKLMDFGVARYTDADAVALTATGGTVGTIAYMAPEQMRGDPLTPAADIYSLALSMGEALTGEWRAVRMSTYPPTIEGELGPVLVRMLAPEPAARPQSVAEVLRILDGDDEATLERAAPGRATRLEPAVVVPRDTGPAWGLRVAVGASVLLVVAFAIVALTPPEPPAPVRPRERIPSALIRPPSQPTTDVSVADASIAIDVGPSSGCDLEPEMKGRIEKISKPSGLTQLTWVRYVPNSYEFGARHPVLLAFHNNYSTAKGVFKDARLRKLAEREQMIVLAMDGQLSFEAWDGVDSGYVREFVDDNAEQLCLDRERIFAFGHGTGGLAVESLACADWVRAIVTTSHRSNLGPLPCAQKPKPYIYFYPTKSRHVPVGKLRRCDSNTRKIVAIETQLEMWQSRNGCTGKPRLINRDGKSYCEQWECATPFVACRVDGGLGWPGTKARKIDMMGCDGKPPTDYPYHERIMEFLGRVP